MRYQTTSFEHLKAKLAELNDDPTKHWSKYPCLEWDRGVGGGGYGQLRHKAKHYSCHCLAFELTYGISDGLHTCHHCDNRRCFRPCHLFAGTMLDNMADMVAKGRRPITRLPGELCGRAKLTAADVLAIRARYIPYKMHQGILAKEFGVSATNIRTILDRKSWKHI